MLYMAGSGRGNLSSPSRLLYGMNSFIIRFQHVIDLMNLPLLFIGFDVMLLKNDCSLLSDDV